MWLYIVEYILAEVRGMTSEVLPANKTINSKGTDTSLKVSSTAQYYEFVIDSNGIIVAKTELNLADDQARSLNNNY